MALKEFKNLPDTSTPINAENLNNNFNSIVESGSNENGNYVKYADGTMICYRTYTYTVNVTTSWGSLYYGNNYDVITFPAQFIEKPHLQLSAYNTNLSFWLASYTITNIYTDYFSGITVLRPTPEQGVEVVIRALAIGKWK